MSVVAAGGIVIEITGARGPGLTNEQQDLISSIPGWLTGGLVSAGELAPDVKGLNLALPVPIIGASVVLDGDAQPIGFTIASGQSGGAASLIGYPLHDKRTIAELAGKTIRIIARYFATANFRTLKPLNPIEPVDVGRFVGDTDGALVFEAQTGTELTRIVEYDVVGDEDYIGIIAQVAAGAPTTGTAMTLRQESLTYLVVGDSPATVVAAIVAKAAERFGVSLLAEGQPPTGSLSGGATWLRDPTTNYINGIAVGNGINGNGSNLAWYWLPAPEDFPLLRGARTRFTVSVKTSVGNARPPKINIKGLVRASGGDFLGEYRAPSEKQSSGRRVYVVEGIIDAGGEQISVGFEDQTNAAASGAQSFQIDDVLLEIISTADGALTGAQATMQLQRNILARDPRRQLGQEVSVAASGGDFTSLYAAFAGSVAHQVINLKSSLLYTASTISTRPFAPTFENAIVRGVGPSRPVVALRQPASTILADIEGNSTADPYYSGQFSNLHIIGRNVRYASHDDDGNLNRDQHNVYTDIVYEHEGNDDAIAYQTSIGGVPNNVWRNCAGAGIGGNSGGSKTYTRCGFLGWNFDALIGHGASFADRPFKLTLTDCWADPRATTAGDHRNGFFWAVAAGDTRDEIRMDGFTTAAPIMLGCSPWAETDPAKIPANKMNISFGGSGVSHVPFLIEDDGSRALRITSAKTGSTSSVAITGTAAPKLLGSAAQISTVTGAAGLSASVTGWLDVGDHLVGSGSDVDVTRLGKRVATGDVLTVTIDGGSPISVTLTANQTNTTILAAINAALGGLATAELVNMNERYRPRFADQEVYVYNAGTTAILRKRAVAWANSGRPSARVMTPIDPPSLFAGVAYETIKPGAWGRVKSAGAVRVSMDIERADAGAFVAGDTFGVATFDGKFAIGSDRAVMHASNSLDLIVPPDPFQAARTAEALDAAVIRDDVETPSGYPVQEWTKDSGQVLDYHYAEIASPTPIADALNRVEKDSGQVIEEQALDGGWRDTRVADDEETPVATTAAIATDGRSLSRWRAKRAVKAKTGAGKQRAMLAGDSWFDKLRIPQALADALRITNGNAGGGWISCDSNLTGSGDDLAPLDGATWTQTGGTLFDASSGAAIPAFGCSHDGKALYTTGTDFVGVATFVGTQVSIFRPKTTGSLRYRIDGGSWTTITGDGTGALQVTTISGLTLGLHTLEIDTTVNTGGGLFAHFGIYYATTAGVGVEVLKCGNSGQDSSQLANYASTYIAPSVAVLDPDVIIFILGTNDYRRAGNTPTAFRTTIEAMVTAIRAVSPTVGFLFIGPADTSGTVATPLVQYVDAMRALALAGGHEFYDMHADWSTYAVENARGQFRDALHLNDTGAFRAADAIENLFLKR